MVLNVKKLTEIGYCGKLLSTVAKMVTEQFRQAT